MLMKTFHGYDRLVLVSAGALMLSMLARGVVAKDLINGPEWAVAGIMVMVAVGLTFYLNPEVVRLQELAFATTETEAKKRHTMPFSTIIGLRGFSISATWDWA